MVSFDARTTVTTTQDWASAEEWVTVPELTDGDLASITELVVFAAHADDETLGVGGLLARVGQRGIPVRIVVATGDEGREGELRAALAELGVAATVDMLGLADGGLKHDLDGLRDRVASVLGERRAGRWVLAPWPGDRHGDHRSLGREVGDLAADSVTTVFFYPVWLWQWGRPDDVPWGRLVEVALTERERSSKARAIGHFTGQLDSPSNPGGVLSSDFIRHASAGREVLIRPEWASLETHFDELHARRADPWAVQTSWYEKRKRGLLLAALPSERFDSAFEIGCSIGELTAALAKRCDRVLAVDSSAVAVHSASQRTAGLSAARVQRMRIPTEWPGAQFDLIVISEVAYYLASDQWARTIQRCRRSLRPGGIVVLCHWLGVSDDFAQSGEDAHTQFRRESGMTAVVEHREADFVLEVFE